jgi:hypothetical protein
LCAASRPVKSLPLSKSVSPGCHLRDFLARERVEVDAAGGGEGVQWTSGQRLRSGGSSFAMPGAVEREVRVPGGGAVRDHADRFDAACVG